MEGEHPAGKHKKMSPATSWHLSFKENFLFLGSFVTTVVISPRGTEIALEQRHWGFVLQMLMQN